MTLLRQAIAMMLVFLATLMLIPTIFLGCVCLVVIAWTEVLFEISEGLVKPRKGS